MRTTTLVLLRHGQTEWNDTGRMQGQADVELDAVGVEQAHAAARTLGGRDFTAVYSSDLVRARHTAEVVAGDLGLPVVLDHRLQEINVGSWSGLTRREIEVEYPGFAEMYFAGQDFRRSATGETVAEMVARVSPAIREIVDRHRGHEVLVVGHGFCFAQLAQHLVGIPAQSRILGGLRNGHWSEIGITDDDVAWVISHNVPPHLHG